jgi:riboflavin biosynthesis pyrimidine reductase
VIDFDRAADAESVSEIARTIYGGDLGPLDRLAHVQAVVERDGELAVFRIGPRAPKSAYDRFVLGFARARARVVVTSGAILRAEPEVAYDLDGPGRSREGLAAWRARYVGEPLALFVLTRDASLAFDHPAFERERAIVFTSSDAARVMRPPAHVRVVGHESPSVERALHWLAREHGDGILVELGPHASRSLYDRRVAIGELLLSVFRGPALAPSEIAGIFLRRDALDRSFARSSPAFEVVEASGLWEFGRYLRTDPRSHTK